jgi:hypothetical protein
MPCFRHVAQALIASAALAGFGVAHAAYSLTAFGPAQWGASDATLGLNVGSVLEDFEDTALVTGLQVRAFSVNGSYGPTSTLPVVFDPATDPNPVLAFYSYPCGVAASCSSLWDGTHSLVNTYTNQAMNYNTSGNWGDIELLFAGGATQVGFSLQQNEQTVTVFVNGNQVAAIAAAPGGGRAGYFRFDVTGGSAPITSLRLSNSNNGDGWAIDHVAFTSAVPEPGTVAMWLAGLAGLRAAARRRR